MLHPLRRVRPPGPESPPTRQPPRRGPRAPHPGQDSGLHDNAQGLQAARDLSDASLRGAGHELGRVQLPLPAQHRATERLGASSGRGWHGRHGNGCFRHRGHGNRWEYNWFDFHMF